MYLAKASWRHAPGSATCENSQRVGVDRRLGRDEAIQVVRGAVFMSRPVRDALPSPPG
jgi:hypothetical protein